MSGDSASTALSIPTAELQALWVSNCGFYAGVALLVFDYFLTLPSEICLVWSHRRRRGVTLVVVLFTALRYSTLALQGLNALFGFMASLDDRGCQVLYYAYQVVNIIGSASLSATFILRTFAIYNRSLAVLVFLALIGGAKVLVSIAISFGFLHGALAPSELIRMFSVCTTAGNGRNASKLLTANLVLIILFDTAVLALTIARTRRLMGVRTLQEEGEDGRGKGYGFFILRDGLLYYLAVEVLVISTIVLNQFESQWTLVTILQGLQPPLSSILVQRLVLCLREVRASSEEHEMEPLGFVHGTAIGNSGATLVSEVRWRTSRGGSAGHSDSRWEEDEGDIDEDTIGEPNTLQRVGDGPDGDRRMDMDAGADVDSIKKDTGSGSDSDSDSVVSRLSFVRVRVPVLSK